MDQWTLPLALFLVPAVFVQEAENGPTPAFREVSQQTSLVFYHQASKTATKHLPETMGSGVALLDYDGDGRLDVFLTNGAHIPDPLPSGRLPQKSDAKYWNRLFRQSDPDLFEDVTVKAGLAGKGYSTGVAAADYDNDGDTDLFVGGVEAAVFYRNNGNGTFSEIDSGIEPTGWLSSASFFDYDRDGLLDLFTCRYLDWDWAAGGKKECRAQGSEIRAYCHPDEFPPAAGRLYRNLGNGHFQDVSESSGIDRLKGKGLGVAISDFDQDGWIDFFVANDSVPQFLFRNRGDGSFEEVALATGAALDQDGKDFAGMGVDFSDYDNDGWDDLVITNLSNEKYALYRNRGALGFDYATYSTGLGLITHPFSGWGVRFLDYDNDGWKDLLIAQGHVMDTIELSSPHLRYRQPPLLLENRRGIGFSDASERLEPQIRQPLAARGLAVGDLDDDGDLDAVMTVLNGPALVLRNELGNRRNWLRLQLVGRKSNRQGIGARIRLTASDGQIQQATITTSSSYQSSGEPVAHFGLGEKSQVERVEIFWPSGKRQELLEIRARQLLVVEEP